MSIRHHLRPMLRTHSALPAQASYGTFLARLARWLHPSACCNSQYEAPISVEDFWTLRCEISEKLREKIATLSSEQLAEVKRQSIEALREYSTDRGMSFPAEVLIVSGTKSHPA